MGCGCKGNNPKPAQPTPQPAQPSNQNRPSLQESVKRTILSYYKTNKSGK